MFSRLSSVVMGCFCGKEALVVEGTRYYARSRLGEGYDSKASLESSGGTLFALHAEAIP